MDPILTITASGKADELHSEATGVSHDGQSLALGNVPNAGQLEFIDTSTHEIHAPLTAQAIADACGVGVTGNALAGFTLAETPAGNFAGSTGEQQLRREWVEVGSQFAFTLDLQGATLGQVTAQADDIGPVTFTPDMDGAAVQAQWNANAGVCQVDVLGPAYGPWAFVSRERRAVPNALTFGGGNAGTEGELR